MNARMTAFLTSSAALVALGAGCGADPVDDAVDGAYAVHAEALAALTCAKQSCQPTTATDTDSGEGYSIATTATAAKAGAQDAAVANAKRKAIAKLKIPKCADGCVPFGKPHITTEDFPGNCNWEGTWNSIPPQPDANGDGIGDWWRSACWNTPGRSLHINCDDPAHAAANPFGAYCFANVIATGVQLCVDDDCLCSRVETKEAVCAAEVAHSAATVEVRGR